MAREYVLKQEGEKRRLVINFRGAAYGADIALFPQCMKDVIEILQEVDANEIVLSEYYERIYNEEQTRLLKGIAEVISKFEADAVWSPSHLGKTTDSRILSARHKTVMNILDNLHSDPFKAYLLVLQEIKTEVGKAGQLSGEALEDARIYLGTLSFIKDNIENTELITKMKKYLAQLGEIPADRGIYHSVFESAIKPSFIGSRIFFSGVEQLSMVDQYDVLGNKVYIYKHPDRVEYLYYVSPVEYTLPPEKYFLLEKTKEVVASHRPTSAGFMDITQARKYFRKIYVATIADIALKNNISLSVEEKEELANIVARYTIGYGILEILLNDRKLTDVYIDSPLGDKPIYLVHSKYGQCQTNIVFSEEEAKALVSRFRALSGRPFDEAHPILDFDLEDLQTRVCVIGKPMAMDGTAFALRLHKQTPWTLAQFLDNKMFNPITAGMLSFFVDAQASQLIVGSRGAGKTSMLTAMMLEIPMNLRIIVQEDTSELPIPQMKRLGFNIQRLKTRPPLGGSSEGEVSAEEALRTALRLGDSVLIVGEVRSMEAKVLFEAMRIGAVGNVVMGTIHGESAYSIWDRLVNDLGVPTTSFKATDFSIVGTQIRFKGSLKRERRLIEITEILKHWNRDPYEEKGFLDWERFDAAKDELQFFEENLGKSDWLKKIQGNRGLKFEDIMAEIKARGEAKQYLVELKRKYELPTILEAEQTVRAHNKYVLMEEKMREEIGGVDFKQLLNEWKTWVKENLVKELMGGKNKYL